MSITTIILLVIVAIILIGAASYMYGYADGQNDERDRRIWLDDRLE